MGTLVEMSDGYYILRIDYGAVTIEKSFMDADKPLEQISNVPKPNGFRLEIPDVK